MIKDMKEQYEQVVKIPWETVPSVRVAKCQETGEHCLCLRNTFFTKEFEIYFNFIKDLARGK